MSSSMGQARRSRRALVAYIVAVVLLMVLGLGLRSNALLTGFVADDYAQIGMLEGHYPVRRSMFDLFNFSNGTAKEGLALMRGGFYPWWSHPELRLTMLRPLSSAMMWLDYRLFRYDAFAYHLHSLAWWLLMLGAIATLFWRVLRPGLALLAFAFLVLDESHGVPLAWIANRCALVSITLAVVALLYYVRYREGEKVRHAVAASAVMIVALGFGEYALAMFGYFLAYELAMRTEPLRARVRALAPIAVPTVAYALLRSLTGHGPLHSGVYVAPDTGFVDFVRALFERVPVMYADLLLGASADFWTFGLPWNHYLYSRGWATKAWFWSPEPWRHVHFWIGVGSLLALAAALKWVRGEAQNRNVRWLFLGSFMAVLPVVGSFPSSRLLVPAIVGFTPMIAAWVLTGLGKLRAPIGSIRAGACVSALLAALLGVYHVVVPAWLTHTEVNGLYAGSVGIRKAVLNMDVDDRQLPGQRLVMISAIEGGTSMYIPLTRRLHGKTQPARCWTLSLTPAPHLLMRDTESSFLLTTTNGFTMFATAPEQLLRDPREPLAIGTRVDLDGMVVTIKSMLRGRPNRIRVEFDVPLEHRSLRFVIPQAHGIEGFTMPKVGQTVTVPAPVIPSA